MNQEVWQDWLSHTDAVARGALSRYFAATGRRSGSLHNAAILHDQGKLNEVLQEWYRRYCFLVHRMGPPIDGLIAHTLYRDWTQEHKDAEKIINQELGIDRRPGHQLPGMSFAKSQGWPDVEMIIAGHHGGLRDYYANMMSDSKCLIDKYVPRDCDTDIIEERKRLALETFTKALEEGKHLWKRVQEIYPKCRLKKIPPSFNINVETEFFLRLMFSCLVDSDWHDTDQWINKQDGRYVEIKQTPLYRFYGRVKQIENYRQSERDRCSSDRMRRLRDSVYNACVKASDWDTGAFTLNAPTGTGKTIAALAWALRHAQRHKLRRIIYVVPYLTITEQNAQVIRDALGIEDGLVFEHHIIADPIDSINGVQYNDRQSIVVRSRLSNWSAPIIITTNVQFFDSIFSNYPVRCRKFHNIARSAVILDECQNIHPNYIQPTCQMLNQFIKHCSTSILLCTATQTQWHRRHKGLPDYLKSRSIIRNPQRLFRKSTRMKVSWPSGKTKDDTNNWSISELSEKMVQSNQSVSIVDTRKKARQVFLELQSKTSHPFHLSTSMNAFHRFSELACLRERLELEKDCHLISTPILEAGIDISFPHVLREMGPLDLIIQAAGRGNRHAELLYGLITVFNLYDNDGNKITGNLHRPPDEWYQKGREVLQQMLSAEGPLDIYSSDVLASYYRKLYSKGSLDNNDICRLRGKWAFDTVGRLYRTIQDQSRPVVCSTWSQTFGEVNNKWNPILRKKEPNYMIMKWFGHAKIPVPHESEVMSAVIRTVHDALRVRPRDRWLLTLMNYFSANIFWRNFQQLQELTTLITTDEETGVDFWNGVYDSRVGLVSDLTNL